MRRDRSGPIVEREAEDALPQQIGNRVRYESPHKLAPAAASEVELLLASGVNAQCAIAIYILLAVPLRPQNLSGLNWKRHFLELDASGRLLLHIPASETKTKKKDLVAELPEDVARGIQWYRRIVLPRLNGDPNGDLFVTWRGTRKDQKTLAGQIIGCIARRVGVHMTPHQFRHFAAASYLEQNPQDFETPRALLGHAFTKTTMVYAGSSTRRAGKAYQHFLFGAKSELRKLNPMKARRHKARSLNAEARKCDG